MTQNQQPDHNQIDQKADQAVNQGIDEVAKRVPQGQKFEQGAKDKADQAVNSELDKGPGGIKKDAENLFHRP